ncbi:MAG: phosphate butyryltransferase [Bacteroidales bacterium]|nr:phosphate butyryltransferase [Bacteroidales bacterium]
MAITHLNQLFAELKNKNKKRLVAAYANDAHTIEAVSKAVDLGIIEATLVGDIDTMKAVCQAEGIDSTKFEMVQESDPQKAAHAACILINQGKGDFIMKGLVSTDQYMRALLNKESGLVLPKAILSHVTVMETPAYSKLLIYGDVAIIPSPEMPEKIAITNYLIKTAQSLGIQQPKVAIIAASEQVSLKMQATLDAAVLSKMAERGQFKNAFVDGPLALDVAIDKESAKIKKLGGKVAGDADCLVFPNIEAGNVFYKTNTKLAGAVLGAMVLGAKVPAVLSSRGDSVQTKLYSIGLAAIQA